MNLAQLVPNGMYLVAVEALGRIENRLFAAGQASRAGKLHYFAIAILPFTTLPADSIR